MTIFKTVYDIKNANLIVEDLQRGTTNEDSSNRITQKRESNLTILNE